MKKQKKQNKNEKKQKKQIKMMCVLLCSGDDIDEVVAAAAVSIF